MGSGYSNLYSGTSGHSQPYASAYKVTSSMHERDIKNGIYHNGKYDKNPTAVNIKDVINGNYIYSKNYNDNNLTYVIDHNGNIIFGRRNGNGRDGLPTPHPTLIGGKDPTVVIAGILKIRGGKIYDYNNMSGHFKPNIKSLEAADVAFSKLSKNLFAKNFVRKDKLK